MTLNEELNASNVRNLTLAHQAACAIADVTNQREFEALLQTFEIEPLDCLQSLIGSYIEDRTRRDHK